ncbi:polymorphic toxin type 5 domain-containing protein [Kribbella sp. CWNU-51]
MREAQRIERDDVKRQYEERRLAVIRETTWLDAAQEAQRLESVRDAQGSDPSGPLRDGSSPNFETEVPAVGPMEAPTQKGRPARKWNRPFRRYALRTILEQEGRHPLDFLLTEADPVGDPDGRNRKFRSWEMYTHEPTVQVGHLTSLHSGAPEFLALEDSTFNQWSNHVGETQEAVFAKTAVLIGGIPVEYRTAKLWQRAGKLPGIKFEELKPSQGWQPDPKRQRRRRK